LIGHTVSAQEHNLVSPVVSKESDTSNGYRQRKQGVEENSGHNEVHDVTELVCHVQVWSLEELICLSLCHIAGITLPFVVPLFDFLNNNAKVKNVKDGVSK